MSVVAIHASRYVLTLLAVIVVTAIMDIRQLGICAMVSI